MPDFAEHIEITDSGIKINGQDVPWYIAKGGVVCDESKGTLTLTLLTGRPGVPTPEPTGADKDESVVEFIESTRRRLANLEANCTCNEAQAEREEAEDAFDPPAFRKRMQDELLLAEALSPQPLLRSSEPITIAVDAGADSDATVLLNGERLKATANRDAIIETKGREVGTATVKIVPDFSAFEGQEFEEAVEHAVQRIAGRALRNL